MALLKAFMPILILLLPLSATFSTAALFADVSKKVGLERWRGPSVKFGGVVIADFDGDGWQDLLIGHHNQFPADLYFNLGNGTFTRADWKFWRDTHAFAPFRATPRSKSLHFFASTGGRNGNLPSSPTLLSVNSNSRAVRKLTNAFFATGRGRAIVPISLRYSRKRQWWSDFMFLNTRPKNTPGPGRPRKKQHYSGTVISGRVVRQRTVKGFDYNHPNAYGTVVDIDGDGRMELVTWHTLRVHRVTGAYTMKDVSDIVLPRNVDLRGVISVVEFDYDNDGRMDLYVTRSATNDIDWLLGTIGPNANDYLFRNIGDNTTPIGGRFIDVSRSAGIPRGGSSRGVTTADFNNDGHVDMLVTQYTGQDWVLLNNGDGTFSRHMQTGYGKSRKTRGDQPSAVDYDGDGWPDAILSEGSYNNRSHPGYVRVMRNVIGQQGGWSVRRRGWLLVRVGAAPTGGASSLHATVRVRLMKGGGERNVMIMTRRVGAPGTTTGVSYVDVVHFGLGDYEGIVSVSVTWRDGSTRIVRTTPRRTVEIGLF